MRKASRAGRPGPVIRYEIAESAAATIPQGVNGGDFILCNRKLVSTQLPIISQRYTQVSSAILSWIVLVADMSNKAG